MVAMQRALDILRLAALDFAAQAAALLGGLAVLAILLHLVERRISRRLSHRFGWRSVLVTGWLGVPIHEVSHLVACWIFGHRVVTYSLFSPDPRTGTLGYVQHAYRRRNLYQLAGNFFIGIAPLVGASVVLLGALYLLLPAARPSLVGPATPEVGAQLVHTVNLAGATLRGIFTLEHVASWQLWVFLVLALSVGTHLSPSWPDLEGAWPGLLLLALLLFAVNATGRGLGLHAQGGWVAPVTQVLAPLLGVLAVSLVLQALFWLLVELVVRLTSPRGGMSLGFDAR